MSQPSRPRILLADDHSFLLEGVRALLSKEFDVVGIAKDGSELLKSAVRLKPDVIVLDIGLPLLNGIEAAKELKTLLPRCPLVMLTGQGTVAYVRAALKAGATGYVLKTAAAEELPAAIHDAMVGKRHLPAEFAHLISSDSDEQLACPLSSRERQILQLIAEGKTGKEIAALACVSIRTVEFHKYNIMNKLNLRTAAELTRYAIHEGLIES